jgi:hypothetical protein
LALLHGMSFQLVSFDVIGCLFCRYQCGYGPQDHHGNPNHARSTKHGCLATTTWMFITMVQNATPKLKPKCPKMECQHDHINDKIIYTKFIQSP